MSIVFIEGPAACGKTRHLAAIKASALSQGFVVIGPVPATGLERALARRPYTRDEDQPDPRKVVVLVDEWRQQEMRRGQPDSLLSLLCAREYHKVFIAREGKRSEWEGL